MGKKRRPTTKGASQDNCAKEPAVESWDDYFMEIARAVARKSKDPRCRVGAVIVSSDNLVLATGFNGFARGVRDDKDLLDDVDEKLRWICHAEGNAILNAGRSGVSVRGCTIYVTKFPCFVCCNAIAQGGVTRIFTDDTWFWNDDPFDGADAEYPHSRKRALLRQVGIKVVAENHPEFSTLWRVGHPGAPDDPADGAERVVGPRGSAPSYRGRRKRLAKAAGRTPGYFRRKTGSE